MDILNVHGMEPSKRLGQAPNKSRHITATFQVWGQIPFKNYSYIELDIKTLSGNGLIFEKCLRTRNNPYFAKNLRNMTENVVH